MLESVDLYKQVLSKPAQPHQKRSEWLGFR